MSIGKETEQIEFSNIILRRRVNSLTFARGMRKTFAFGEVGKFALQTSHTPFSQSEVRLLSPRDINKKYHRKDGIFYLWRRKRDSNPRAFWANGFQDRLVVTASIFLQIFDLESASLIPSTFG